MQREFYALQKGSKTVVEYERELNRLMKFTPDAFKNDEEARMQRFLYGLDPQLQYEVRSFELTTYSAVINKAKLLEQGHKLLKEDSESSGRKRNWEGNSHFGGQNSVSNKKQSTMQFHNRNQQSESVKCWRCKGKHHQRDCRWLSDACLNCGKMGHKTATCSSARPLVGTCFNCGQ